MALTKKQQDALVEEMQPRVDQLAKVFVRYHKLPFDELFSHGMIKVWQIVKDYDPERSPEFGQYAFNYIEGAMNKLRTLRGRQKENRELLELYYLPFGDQVDRGNLLSEKKKTRVEGAFAILNGMRTGATITAVRQPEPTTPEDVAIQSEAQQRARVLLQKALKVLTAKQRQFVLRTKLNGEAVGAVADELRIKDASNTLKKLLAMLGEALEGVKHELKALFPDVAIDDDEDDDDDDEGNGGEDDE